MFRQQRRVDWLKILAELRAAGLSTVAVADELRIARSTPYRWLDGSEPLHWHGEALLQLHRERAAAGELVLAT